MQRINDKITMGNNTIDEIDNLYVIKIGDGPVSVDRYSNQMQYRRRAAQHVAAGPHVAQIWSQRPTGVYL